MPNPDSPPVQAIVVRPGWAAELPTEADLAEALSKQALLAHPEERLLLVPSCSARLGVACAILRAYGCRWRLTLMGGTGGNAALWLLGERADAALIDSAGCERLARAAGVDVDAIAQVLEKDLCFTTAVIGVPVGR